MWELTAWDKKFQGVDKSMQTKIISYKYLLAKDLFALSVPNGNIKLLSTCTQEGWTTEELAGEYLSEGEVVTIPWGKSPDAKNPVKYYHGRFVTGDNRIATSLDTSVLNNKFLYYWMCSNSDLLDTFYRGAGIQHPSMFMVLTMRVPLIPLEDQLKIVEILDTFTSSIDNLKEQIALRRKQYEYYRDQLLDLEGKEGVEMKTLGEITAKITSGKNKNKLNEGDYPVFGSTGKIAFTNTYVYDKQLILVARVGANAGYVYMVDEKCDVTDNTLVVETKDEYSRKFIYYYLVYININQFAKGGGQPLITGALLKNLTIPVPSLQEQQRIVNILDTFEASIQNLEAQLSQREKQYEYYRNKLLTFE
jgi:type I restriction enzyme S subunit